MDRPFAASNCFLCTHFVHLTISEQAAIQPLISTLDSTSPCLGVCMFPQKKPRLLIRRYYFQDEGNCEMFTRGYFHPQTLDIPCPKCKVGRIAITRPVINGERTILLGCSRYPDCRQTLSAVTLKTRCRFCNVPLRLTGGKILKTTCPRCHRSLAIPIALQIWPALASPSGECVHTPKVNTCEICQASISQKKSLIELELPVLTEWINTMLANQQNPYVITINNRYPFPGEYSDLDASPWLNFNVHAQPVVFTENQRTDLLKGETKKPQEKSPNNGSAPMDEDEEQETEEDLSGDLQWEDQRLADEENWREAAEYYYDTIKDMQTLESEYSDDDSTWDEDTNDDEPY